MTITTEVVYYIGMKELELNTDVFNKAVDILGKQEDVGKVCGFSQQAASKYSTGKAKRFRPDYAVKLHHATGGKVTYNQLMPNYDWSIFFN